MSARASDSRLRVVVTGLIGSIPMAGLTLHYLQYVLGFRDLGHEVLYLEDTGSWYYDPDSDSMVDNQDLALNHLSRTMGSFGLDGNWTLVDHLGGVHGLAGVQLNEFLRTADLFVNVTGAGMLREKYCGIPRRVYVDTDPGYVQVRIANGSRKDRDHLAKHNVHLSFGCNIGEPECRVPSVGFEWQPTVQPLAMDLWNAAMPPPNAAFTTVLKWQSYDPVEYQGEIYGLKQEEFRKFRSLPQETNAVLELAMAGEPPEEDLASYGWRRRPARSISDTIDSYRRYIRDSYGEWSVAKSGYVKMRSGWFGDRSASYLASSRPVVLQSTGFERWLATGEGVFSFSTLEEAREAILVIQAAYGYHSRAAREIAEERFDARKVLPDLIASAISPRPRSEKRGPTDVA